MMLNRNRRSWKTKTESKDVTDASEKSTGFLSKLTILPLLLAGLYGFGFFYSLGYLSFFGLSTDMFPRSVDVYAVKTLVALISGVVLIESRHIEGLLWMSLLLAIVGVSIAYLTIALDILFNRYRHRLP
jgi:hypothetical protein